MLDNHTRRCKSRLENLGVEQIKKDLAELGTFAKVAKKYKLYYSVLWKWCLENGIEKKKRSYDV